MNWIPKRANETESSESLRRLALMPSRTETRLGTYMANFPGTFFLPALRSPSATAGEGPKICCLILNRSTKMAVSLNALSV